MQQVIVESPGRQSIVAACARSVGRLDAQCVPAEQMECALLAEQPDANSPQSRARPKNTEDVKCFIRLKLEQSLFETPRRALAREAGRLRPLSGRSTRAMRNFLPPRSALLLVHIASVAMARDRFPSVRSVYVRNDPQERTEQLFVTRDVTTVLRFEQPCTEAGTKMLGWEGRFEPVACAGKRWRRGSSRASRRRAG
ncbi:DUF2381 family protein [Archangium violaceum]|uniref:DUF2381 family protein n=1 Tax=Archangium violaceum TaxID=83451 RepID=UPI0036DF7EB2